MKIKHLLLFILIPGLLIGACNQAPQIPSEPAKIRIAVLPILDNLPMYVADQEGLFQENNVMVEFIPASSAAERDQIINAGQADGMINEIVSTLLYNKDDVIQVQIVRYARTATPEHAQYYILSSGTSGIDNPDEFKNVEIGISQGTIIEYVTDRLLQAEGLIPEEIKTIAVPKIDLRMSLLASGELPAATLPDPLAFLAEQQGAKIVLDDSTHPEYGHSTYAFRKSFIDDNPEAIRGFLAAIDTAIGKINADPTKYENLLTEKNLVPAPLIGTYQMPPFPASVVPPESQWNDVLAWAKEKGLVNNDMSYEASVTEEYLP